MTQPNRPPRMEKLAKNRRTKFSAGLPQFFHSGNDVVRTRIQKGILEPITWMQGHSFQDDQARSAFRPFLVVGNQFIRYGSIIPERGSVRWIENPVADGRRPKLNGFQQVFERWNIHGIVITLTGG